MRILYYFGLLMLVKQWGSIFVPQTPRGATQFLLDNPGSRSVPRYYSRISLTPSIKTSAFIIFLYLLIQERHLEIEQVISLQLGKSALV